MKTIMKKAIPPTGAHFRNIAWRLILRAALRYFADSDRSEVDKVDMPGRRVSILARSTECDSRSKLSPRHNRSSMFLVMIRVTSCSSAFILSRLLEPPGVSPAPCANAAVCAVRVSS